MRQELIINTIQIGQLMETIISMIGYFISLDILRIYNKHNFIRFLQIMEWNK
jgi:hypothetical protein